MRFASRHLSRRLPLMIASLLMAIILWLLVIAEEKIEAGFMVPLVFNNIPSTVVIDEPPMATVYVQIRGSKQAVENILPQQIGTHIDLSMARPGDEFVQITPQNVVLPPGLTVLGVYPPYLDLKFLAKRPVPIKVRVIGKPAEGYEIKKITATPDKVEIVGSLRRVESIKEVNTYPVDIDGFKRSLRIKAEFVQPGGDVRLLELKPTEVKVDVAARKTRKTFEGVPVKGVLDLEIEPDKVTVVVEGDVNLLKDLNADQIEVEVDAEAGGDSAETVSLRTKVPPGVSLISLTPGQVSVR